MGGGAGDVELGLELLAPLPDQRRRGQHQHALDHAAQQVLLEHHAGFDGLAEPDLVGEQHPAAELLEHLAHGLDLVPEGLDAAQMRQAEQLVEALREAEMGKALAQTVPAAVVVGGLLQAASSGARSSSARTADSMSISGSWGTGAGAGAAGAGGAATAIGTVLSPCARLARGGSLGVDRSLNVASGLGRVLALARLVAIEDPVVLAVEPAPAP